MLVNGLNTYTGTDCWGHLYIIIMGAGAGAPPMPGVYIAAAATANS